MTLIADSNFVYALFNSGDTRHSDAMSFVSQITEVMLVPDVVVPEVCYLIMRDLGHGDIREFLEYFAQLDAALEPIGMGDLGRARDILITYDDAALDIVDCCIMAIAERLDITRIATFDRRDFGMFKPNHCDYLELLP